MACMTRRVGDPMDRTLFFNRVVKAGLYGCHRDEHGADLFTCIFVVAVEATSNTGRRINDAHLVIF